MFPTAFVHPFRIVSRIFAPAFPLTLALASFLLLLGLTGCSGLFGGNVTVRFQETPDLAAKAPVMQDETTIGEVVSVGSEKAKGASRSTPAARLSIDGPHLEDLRQGSVFIVQEDERGRYLRHELVDPQSPPKRGELVFLGFNSYQEYLLWRASRIGARKIDDFLRILDDALKDLDRTPLVEPEQGQRF